MASSWSSDHLRLVGIECDSVIFSPVQKTIYLLLGASIRLRDCLTNPQHTNIICVAKIADLLPPRMGSATYSRHGREMGESCGTLHTNILDQLRFLGNVLAHCDLSETKESIRE